MQDTPGRERPEGGGGRGIKISVSRVRGGYSEKPGSFTLCSFSLSLSLSPGFAWVALAVWELTLKAAPLPPEGSKGYLGGKEDPQRKV